MDFLRIEKAVYTRMRLLVGLKKVDAYEKRILMKAYDLGVFAGLNDEEYAEYVERISEKN